jgi:hypothetical protein
VGQRGKEPFRDEKEAHQAHKRLLKYPMIRLRETGLGTFLVQNHGRLCRPANIGTCANQTV